MVMGRFAIKLMALASCFGPKSKHAQFHLKALGKCVSEML